MPGGEIVDDEDAVPLFDGVDVHLDCVGSVLEVVADLVDRLGSKFPAGVDPPCRTTAIGPGENVRLRRSGASRRVVSAWDARRRSANTPRNRGNVRAGLALSERLARFPRIGGLLRPLLQRMARVFPELPVPMTAYIDIKIEPVRNMGNARDVPYWDPLLVPFVRLKTLASLGSEQLARPVEEIEVPIMILQAEMDTIFPTDYIEKIHARLNCEKSLKVYPGLPHYMIVDHVSEILEDVVAWMEPTCGTRTTSES